MENLKKIVIITARAGYPNGFGASSIIRKYVSGFNKNGYNVSVLLLRPSEHEGLNTLNTQVKGENHAVSFEYMSKTLYTSKSVLKRLRLYILAEIRTIKYLYINRKKIERVFFYSPDYFLSVFIIQIMCKILGLTCDGIKTESSYSDKMRTKWKFWKVKERLIYTNFNKMIVITDYLKEQLKKFGYRRSIIVLPIIVDEGMFKDIDLNLKEKSLIYLGSMNYEKELIYLFDAFSNILITYPEWKLIVIGSFEDKLLEHKIKKHIEKLNIGNNIVWKGKLSSEDVAFNLSTGGVMLLPRIDDEYSRAGFPIKLGEYLLTGAPVVVTDTGDIAKYLTHNVDAFIVEPNDVSKFSNCVVSVIDDYDGAIAIGLQGQATALELFGSKQICRKMMEDNNGEK